MKNHKSLIVVGIVALTTLIALTLLAGMTQAQAPQGQPEDPAAPDDTVGNYIPVQGRLTDAGGNPINASLTITFRLYAVPTGGTELCRDTNSVVVNKGLFNSEIYGNCAGQMTGQQLYLALQVGSDPEMTPRQPIYAVPYAWSLKPGAEISGTISGDAILHIENWGDSGRGLRAYAMSSTGANYGVVGASRSSSGYGGYFYNSGGGTGLKVESDTGVAFSATGSGIIKSTADITIAVSPLKMIPQWESIGDLEFLSDGAYMEIRPLTSGTQIVQIPVDLPAELYGTATKLRSVRICYRVDQAASFVATTILSQGTDTGTLNQAINDTTDRTSTTWDCYTATATTPEIVEGSVYVQLSLSFANTGSGHDIRIGNIALRLTEQ